MVTQQGQKLIHMHSFKVNKYVIATPKSATAVYTLYKSTPASTVASVPPSYLLTQNVVYWYQNMR